MEKDFSNDDFFEGNEKILEVWYSIDPPGLRRITREEWDEILKIVGATIISTVSTPFADAYVLSESSLFVWGNRIIIKTCGVTTLLLALPHINETVSSYFPGLRIQQLFYSHNSFLQPNSQKIPHQNLDQERAFLQIYLPLGEWAIFKHNKIKSKTWSLFTYTDPLTICDNSIKDDITVEIMMYGLSDECFKLFARDSYDDPDTEMRTQAKIHKLISGMVLDDQAFSSYGYSVNGCRDLEYFTIHVTPQPSCSYASFETNLKPPELTDACLRAIDIFKPSSYCLAIIHGSGFQCYAETLISKLNQLKKNQLACIKQYKEYSIYYACFQ